jgi:flagellar protein FliL
MAEEDKDKPESETEDGGVETKKGMSMILKIILIVLLASVSLMAGLVGTMGVGGVKNLVAGSSEKPDVAVSHDSEPVEEEPVYGILNLEEMIVNITGYTATGRTTSRFLKLKVSIVYDETIGQELASRKLFLRDAFQDYLRQLNEKDLAGSIGLATLKAELLKRAKSIAGNEAPKSVLVGDLIIQ